MPAHSAKSRLSGPFHVENVACEDAMDRSMQSIRRLMLSDDGPTAVEYAVMLALIIIVCLVSIKNLGTNSKTTFTNVANSVAS
jgi:pilus assembly protein Flp/PilA